MVAASPRRSAASPTRRDAAGAVLLLVIATASATRAADPLDWRLAPLRVEVRLATDDRSRPGSLDPQRLARSLQDRLSVAQGFRWQTQVAATGLGRPSGTEPVDSTAQEIDPWIGDPPLPVGDDELVDKRLYLDATAETGGVRLRGRELDLRLRRWGPLLERQVRQASFTDAALGELASDAHQPLARIELLPDDADLVQLSFRGEELPGGAEATPPVDVGAVLQPLLLRTDRTGRRLDDAATVVPWTYLTIQERTDAGWLARVDSGLKSPLGVRRRGFVEQLALAYRNPTSAVRIRFHARRQPEQGLHGYEVFRLATDGSSQPLGTTDGAGCVVVPGDRLVSLLLLRSGGRVLAKTPIAAQGPRQTDVPVADDMTRVRAQAELLAIREEVVDAVARRAILTARVRAALERQDLPEAKRLVGELSNLPTTANFAAKVNSAERRIAKSPDPAVQRAIERQFAEIRELLGEFLDSRPVTALEYEVNTAGAPREPAEAPATPSRGESGERDASEDTAS